MPKMEQKPSILNQTTIEIVKNRNPATVEELVKLVQQKHPLPQQEIIEHILNLQSQGKLHLKEKHSDPPSTINGYLLSPQARWYWAVIALALTGATIVFTVPENAYLIVYARYLLGSILILWLPGYSIIKAIFPKVPIPTRSKELDSIERVALSLGMSLALIPIIGLLLNYTPWGITPVPITLSLLALTVAFATIAIIRENQNLQVTQ